MNIEMKSIAHEQLGEKYYTFTHKSGVTAYIWPKDGYTGAYAVFGAKVGSIDDNFILSGEQIKVPAGIAHFLEHKLFENEEGDAFTLFAGTGASANAYTSFDRTCYLFSSTENFEQSFEILLSFVQSPYFTKETVEKEQGIIGQEIKMYEDNPDWRVLFNLLGAVYHNHPIKTDIAGTVGSIAEITAETLHKCYNAFYNPGNMVIAAAGNVDAQKVAGIIENGIKNVTPLKLERRFPKEPAEIVKPFIEQHFDVGMPMFMLGFKETPDKDSPKNRVLTDILLYAIAGTFTPLYRKMLDSGLINKSFSWEYMTVPGVSLEIFGGESNNPEQVKAEICAEIERLKIDGITEECFECAKRSAYGSLVAALSSINSIANNLSEAHFYGFNIFDLVTIAAEATLEDVQNLLENRLNINNCVLSVVR